MRKVFNNLILLAVVTLSGSLTASDDYEETASKVDALRGRCFDIMNDEGDYPAALKECQKGLELADRELPSEHPSRVNVLLTIGQVYMFMSDYREALSYLIASRNIFRRTLPPNHPYIASALFAIGQLYMQMGDYPQALSNLEDSLKIRRETLPAKHPEIANSLFTIGQVYRDMGDYPKALKYLEEDLAIKKKSLPPEHPSIASSLFAIGKIYQDMYDYSKALTYQEESLKIKKKTLPADHPSIASSLLTIRQLYWQMGDYPKAHLYLEDAMKIWKKSPPAYHNAASSLYTIGQVYMQMGDYPKALSLFKYALKIDKETFSPDHPNIAVSLYTIGQIYSDIGVYPQALKYLEKAFKIYKKTLPFNHPDIASSLNMLGMVNADMGKRIESRKFSTEGVTQIEKHIQNTFSALNEQQRINLVRQNRLFFDKYLSFVDVPKDSKDNYNHLLRWKGSALVALLAERDAVFAGDNPELRKLFDEKNKLVKDYSTLLNSRPENEKDAAKLKKDIADKQNDIAGLERKISALSSDYRKTHALTTAGVHDICKALPEDTALVDFLKYDRYNPAYLREKDKNLAKWEGRYTAFVLVGGKECGNPSRIEIFDADKIDDWINTVHDALSKGDINSMKNPLDALSRNMWSPIAEKLKGKKKVYIVPDGAIAKLPFDVLLDNKGEMLIKNLTIGYLDLPQSIITIADKERKHNSGFFAVGGVDFDNRVDKDKEEKLIASKGAASEKLLYAMAEKSDKGALTRGNKDSKWLALPGTGKELKEIVPLMKKKENIGVELSGKEATKKAVSTLMQGKRYVMIGTHGKFEGIKTLEIKEEMRGLTNTAPKATAEHDPMRASYLVFAGANKEKEEAYLTAAEIMVLDLRGTELTVLSACQTGLGNENSGEGIMGLRRAFIGAGSDALVLSLWEIEDEVSAQIMKTFMEERMKNPDTVEAMRKAKLKLMEKEPNPVFWAPFVVTGK